MKQYIDKSELLEELKKCEKICEDYMLSHKDAVSQGIANAKRAMCQHIIKIINTLETKEANETIDFFSVHSREEVAEINKRIEKSQKEYDAKLRDKIMKAKDFPMTD